MVIKYKAKVWDNHFVLNYYRPTCDMNRPNCDRLVVGIHGWQGLITKTQDRSWLVISCYNSLLYQQYQKYGCRCDK